MKNGFKALWAICFLFITLLVDHCGVIEHKNPLDPENPDTHGKVTIAISDPQDGDSVTMTYTVMGTVSPRAEITVVIHPLAANEYWVQNFPVVDNDGNWQSLCYFGTKDRGIGENFEVFAVTPKKKLKVAQVLYSLPEYTNISNVVTVTRPE